MRALAGGAKPKRFTDRAIHAHLFTGVSKWGSDSQQFNTATFPALALSPSKTGDSRFLGASILHFDTRNAATIESTMAERRSKRPKITRGEDDYLPGNITEIELHNFMTFNDLKCKPGSRLNLVIGPNGSGKSSLVCAIALGLGGDPQLLGRASSIGAYVKRGEESGYIKISLRGDTEEEQITIMRKIDTRNKSEWLFNGNHF
ncbi:Structural maintenance of chromosomes protein 5 [Vitis vinifera]|uniref:Structural maintenance of chromosomes protein 5 n=1 Tax=Vitis vinifera TaxID=29760 RepID=A0A438IUK6_VITVI|nr:Structural maintenance of chromosomes protein 5 [Vitis vinifera]